MCFSFFQPCVVHPARTVVTVYEITSAHVWRDILGHAVRKVSVVLIGTGFGKAPIINL